MHRAKFVNLELSVLHSGAVLHVKERTGRLQSVRDENNHRQHRKDDEHDRERDRDIDRALEKSVQWIFQRSSRNPMNRKPPSSKCVTEWRSRSSRSLKMSKRMPS